MGGQGLIDTSQGYATRSAFLIAAVVVVLDQITKVWAVAALEGSPAVLIEDFLRLRVTRNPGAAFSLFTDAGQLLGFIAIAVALIVVVALPRVERRIEQIALALVLGGAVGNLVDRVFRGEGILDGAVVDFVDFSFWPAFNVADSGISIGVVILVLASFFPPSDAGEQQTVEARAITPGDG